jgi:hypothetical protein
VSIWDEDDFGDCDEAQMYAIEKWFIAAAIVVGGVMLAATAAVFYWLL